MSIGTGGTGATPLASPLTGGSQGPSTLLDSGKVSLLRHRRRQDPRGYPVTTQ
ncbi:hypothetical protein BZL29_0080 [Mycobacterium kansasii]|uniref:Uncharacterized protein n=1 Tax=Mycobacterium kansasii TaxID=1768 RepID=A0A1V3XX77_MYCKA|nr:hypothetical protein BZL29_0080 [Mycobacterium kansasii]